MFSGCMFGTYIGSSVWHMGVEIAAPQKPVPSSRQPEPHPVSGLFQLGIVSKQDGTRPIVATDFKDPMTGRRFIVLDKGDGGVAVIEATPDGEDSDQ